MLKSLHIENYVLIDNQDIEFPEGLVVISGPTGAGKSIIVGALGLLLGAKADAAVIAADEQNCIVEGEFEAASAQIESFCLENDLQYDNGHFIIRRVVSRTGRSRAFFNDDPVSVSLLEQIGSYLVDIHSQHDTLLLTSKAFQLSVLDSFCGNEAILSECAAAYSELSHIDSEIASITAAIEKAQSESDYNSALLSKLEEANLRDGELAELEAEQFQLGHSEQIKELLVSASELFNPADDNLKGINASLACLERDLQKLADFLPSFGEFPSRIESARIDLKDMSDEIAGANEAMDCSPERLQWLDERIASLYSLMKRHGVETEAELIAKRDQLRSLVGGSQQLTDRLEDLSKEREECAARLDGICAKLHEIRSLKAVEFSRHIEENLHFMELEGAGFSIELTTVKTGASGYDEACFMFCPFGARPAPVAKCASGGELSRIMLSLKQLMSAYMKMPTMVFDEIDTGVSGSVAARMGSVICKMGDNMQVFAITHLPQVAAKGQAHYLVSKSADGGRTVSTIKKLSIQERVLEVARMLSGTELTPEAIANAKSLLG